MILRRADFPDRFVLFKEEMGDQKEPLFEGLGVASSGLEPSDDGPRLGFLKALSRRQYFWHSADGGATCA